MSPALAGGFLATEPPGKPSHLNLSQNVGEKRQEKMNLGSRVTKITNFLPGAQKNLDETTHSSLPRVERSRKKAGLHRRETGPRPPGTLRGRPDSSGAEPETLES